ncbi:NAD(P)H-dependent flavin oxidoreductase [Peribacillus sp. SCS-155]|uniref:NAD(P)H-dependent flavin oxidoreductase n=1 Tax=Peribacillus sedimenti TaxID=3115297 RepID=UPI0039061DA5
MNRICQMLNLQLPVIQGGMGNISHPQLTAAVSNAGALGTIGAGTMSPAEIEEKIIKTKELTSKPFALNIAITVSPYTKELVELAIKHDISAVTFSAGNPAPYVPLLHAKGIKVMAVVGSVKHALKAEAASVDIIIGEGYEAAGINSPLETTTLTLIPQLVDTVQVPVIAAGGIADGRGLAAMLALGAEGVQMGTRFIATKEAPYSEKYKQRIIDAGDGDTIIVGRTVQRIRRVLKNPYTAHILQTEAKGLTPAEYDQLTDESHHIIGAVHGDEDKGFWNSGQISGLIKEIPTVSELIQSMKTEMKLAIERLNHYS